MISVVRRYQEAAGRSVDSMRIRSAPHSKFLTIRDGVESADALKAVLFFGAWYAKARGPVYIFGAPAELMEFWTRLHELIESLPCRKYLAFGQGQLRYVGRSDQWVVFEGRSTVPASVEGDDLVFNFPDDDENALWVFPSWTTAPAAFLKRAPLGLVVPRWIEPPPL